MKDMDEVSNSQSDEETLVPHSLDRGRQEVLNELSWGSEPQFLSSQRARKVRRVANDLKPQGIAFQHAPSGRRRRATFAQNYQFTVRAAEFLNLASRDELNNLYNEGYDADAIERLLERKYRKKQRLWYSSGVVHHRFKRRSVEAWIRVMDDASIFNSNTTLDEDQLMKELDSNERRRLKIINDIPLDAFSGEASSSEETSDIERNGPNTVPGDRSIVELNTSQQDAEADADSQIKLPSKIRAVHNIPDDSQQIERNENLQHASQVTDTHSSQGISQNTAASESSIQLLDNIFDEVSNVESVTISPKRHKYVDISKVLSSPVQLMQASEAKDICSMEPPSSPHLQPRTELVQGRRLRHRNIVNRNPYMVDRAEYLGLSTPVELSEMAESGKTDDEIIAYLDEVYQMRRAKRKESGYGYGPYSKQTFKEVMELPLGGGAGNPATLEVRDDDDFETQGQENDDDDEDNNPSIDGEFDNTFDLIDDQFVTKRKNTFSERSPKPPLLQPYEQLTTSNLTEASSHALQGSAIEDKRFCANPLLHRENKLSTLSEKPKLKHPPPGNPVPKEHVRSVTNSASTETTFEYTSRKPPIINQDVSVYTKSYKAFNDPLLDLAFSDTEEDDTRKTSKRVSEDTSESRKLKVIHRQPMIRVTPSLGVATLQRSNTGFPKTKNTSKRDPTMRTEELPRSKSLNSIKRAKDSFTPDHESTEGDEKGAPRKKPKKASQILAASYAPKTNTHFEFNRDIIKGSFQAEGISAFFKKQHADIGTEPKFNPEAARGINVIKEPRVSRIADNENWKTMRKLWHWNQDESDLNDRRLKVLLELKPEHFSEFDTTSKLITSNVIKSVHNMDASYYHKSNVVIELDKSSNIIQFPISSASTVMKAVKDFFTFLGVALRGGKLSNQRLVQIRKSLINLVRLCWNLKRDLPSALVDIGLQMNEFMNSLKEHPPDPESFCFFSPFLLVCMFLFQRFLGSQSEHYATFQKSARWIQKRFVLNFFQIQYQLFYIPENKVYFEALNLFLMFSKNAWDIITDQAVKLNPVDVTCALYFMTQSERIEADWAFFIQHLTKYESMQKHGESDSQIERLAREVCVLVIKINQELNWDIDPQVLIKTFRLLSAHKFNNIGSKRKPKATIYPFNEPETLIPAPEDGCLDLYFKLLTAFAQGYIKNCSSSGYQLSFLETDLTPGSTLNGYTSVQLQNRAKVILMLWIIFDKDVVAYLTNIIEFMLKEHSFYSVKSAISLLRLVATRMSRKPIVTSLKFLPQIIENVNSLQDENELNVEFKELLATLKSNIVSDEQLPMKYVLQCMIYLMKLANMEAFEESVQSIFEAISESWTFSMQVVTDKDKQKVDKLLDKLGTLSKKRLVGKSSSHNLKKVFLKFWMFSRVKLGMTAPKIYFQEWMNIGSDQVRERFDLTFFSLLVEAPAVFDVKGEVIAGFYKHLANEKADVRPLFRGIIRMVDFPTDMSKFSMLTAEEFAKRRIEFTVKALSAIVGKCSAGDDCAKNTMNSFIKTMRARYDIEIDSQFIREVSTYLYTVLGDVLETPEWKYIETKLKLETVTGSLSKQIAYASDISTSRLMTSIVKSYIAAIINGELATFTSDFKNLFIGTESSMKLVTAVCNIVSFHIYAIKKGGWEFGWIHVNFWLKMISSMLEYSWLRLDFLSILEVLKETSTLSAYYAKVNTCIYYYHDSVRVIYIIIRMLSNQLKGVSEGIHLCENLALFAGMDPHFMNQFAYHQGKLVSGDDETLLAKTFHQNSLILKSKYYLVQNQQMIFEMSEKASRERSNTQSYLESSLKTP